MGAAGAKRTRVWAMHVEDLFADIVEGEVPSPVEGPVRMPPPQLFAALPWPAEFQQTFLVEVPFETFAGARYVAQVRVTLMDAQFYESWRAEILRVRPQEDGEFGDLRAAVRERLEAAGRRRAEAAASAPPLPPPVAAPDGDERAGVLAAAKRLSGGDEALAAALMERLRPSVRIRPCAPERAASRLGGVPFLPEGARWPRRTGGSPLGFLAQIDLAEVPRVPLADPLPRDGRLLLFYDVVRQPWGYRPEHGDGFAIRYVPADVPVVATAPPADTHDELLLPISGATFEADATIDLFALDLPDAQRDAVWAAHEAEEPHHRLLGEPEPVQNDPRGEVPSGDGWTLLAQIDSGTPLEVDWGDSGRLYFLVPAADLRAQRFDRGWVVLQCH